MPARRHRFILLAGIATLALLAAGARHALAQQVALTNTRGLDFGRFVAGSGGTVVVGPSGLRSRTGAVVLLSSPNVGQATFNVNRNNSKKVMVDISLPSNGSVRLTSGVNSMPVGNFLSLPGTPMSIQNPVVLAVGATLTVAPNQPPGDYSGNFSVTVNFQ